MKLAIPVFHTEFDPLQLSFTQNGKIPPNGDFGDFWWLFWLFSCCEQISEEQNQFEKIPIIGDFGDFWWLFWIFYCFDYY